MAMRPGDIHMVWHQANLFLYYLHYFSAGGMCIPGPNIVGVQHHQHHGGSRPPAIPKGKPPRPVPLSPSDGMVQPTQPKRKMPELEKYLVDQLSKEEQDSLNSKFEEATAIDKKALSGFSLICFLICQCGSFFRLALSGSLWKLYIIPFFPLFVNLF